MENPLPGLSALMKPSLKTSVLSIAGLVVDNEIPNSRAIDSSHHLRSNNTTSAEASPTKRAPKSAPSALTSSLSSFSAPSSSNESTSSPCLGSRKRPNKQAMLSPTLPARRKTVSTTSEVVVHEGELHAEEVVGGLNDGGDHTNVRNIIGWIRCRVVTRTDGIYLESRYPLVACGASSLVINLQRAQFEWESMQNENRFQLTLGDDDARQQEQQQPRNATRNVLIFEVPRADEYDEWVQTLSKAECSRLASISSEMNDSSSPPPSPSSPQSHSQVQVHDSHIPPPHDPKEQQQHQHHHQPHQDQEEQGDSAHQEVTPLTATSPIHHDFLVSNPPKKMHIILIRHGHYINAHAKNVCDAQQVLSLLGRQQAVCAGKYLNQLYSKTPFRDEITIYHSDMARAVETAKIIGKRLGDDCCALSESSLLREAWPGTPYSRESCAVVNAKQEQISQELEMIDRERMQKAYSTFFALNKPEEWDDRFRVIVCHANLIRYFLCRAMGIDAVGAWGHFEINHCGVTRVDLCENRPVKIISVNETGHLPHNLITSSEDHL